MKAEDVSSAVTIEKGYLGNLSPEQGTKLRELWKLLLEAFEFDGSENDAGHADAHTQAPRAAPEPAEEDGAGTAAAASAADHQVDLGERARHRNNKEKKPRSSSTTRTSATMITAAANAAATSLQQSWLSMVKQENPDALLLRFLRARKWDVAQAFSMLRAALLWRSQTARVDEELLVKGEAWCVRIEKTGTTGTTDANAISTAGANTTSTYTEKEKKDAHDYLQQFRMGKVYFRGADLRHRPIGYVQVALHKPGAQSPETLEKLVVQVIETARCLLDGTAKDGSFCVVFDLTGFSLSNMEWGITKFIIQAFQANYPECLGTLLIHNAPWIFSGLWKIIRGLLDPVVAAKINFTNSTKDLEKYIARENIISRLGGGDTWTYTYHEPSADEDICITDSSSGERERIMRQRGEIAERFLAATQRWITHTVANEQDEAGKRAQLREAEIEALKRNYWELDPYVRSRTNIDRTGVIRPNGSIEMYPDRKTNDNK